MTDPEFEVRPERAEDIPSLNEIAARAFGPGRFARTAYRVREKAGAVVGLSLIAWTGDTRAGSLRFTAIDIGTDDGALLLGPLMVDPKWAGKGCGRALVARGLELAREAGFALVLLVGDMSYFGRFGFAPVPAGQIVFPGPVDPARILAVELVPGALEKFSGVVQAEGRA